MPEQLNDNAVIRLVAVGRFRVRVQPTPTGRVQVAEPARGRGPCYVQDPRSHWWSYVYDVAVVRDPAC
jgi:hypothetical protein